MISKDVCPIWWFLFAIIMLGGCKAREEQYEVEARSMFGIMRMLERYHHEHSGIQVTNLLQLLRPGESYPYEWDRRFSQFGEHAGFTNSIFEKYVFFPPGLTNRWIVGELVVMNAKPFPGPDGLQRKVVSKADDVFHYRPMDEAHVQQMFSELGIPEPNPAVMPPPPPAPLEERRHEPPLESVSNFIIRTAMAMGFSGDQALVVRHVVFGLPFVLLLFLVFAIWRRSRQQRA